MRESSCPPTRYLDLLQTSKKRLLESTALYNRDMRVVPAYAALDLTCVQLSLRVQKLVHLLSFYRAQFPLQVILDGLKVKLSPRYFRSSKPSLKYQTLTNLLEEIFIGDATWDEDILRATFTLLQNYALITVVDLGSTLLVSMHSLTRGWIQAKFDKKVNVRVRGTAARLLSSSPVLPGSLSRHQLPNAKHFISFWPELHSNEKCYLVQTLCLEGADQALPFAERQLAELSKKKGRGSIDTTVAIAMVASCYHNLKNYEESINLWQQVVERRRKVLGPEDRDTLRASSKSSLGLEEQLLEQQRKVLGEDHYDTFCAAINLVATYQSQGKTDEAIRLQQETLALVKKHLGMTQVIYFRSKLNLASMQRDLQGAYAGRQLVMETLGAGHSLYTFANQVIAGLEQRDQLA
ncbi:hypothetical protein PIIN_06924 [Serendipita indica DSM 11827]|uniref:Kinesin light chain n=1 Tax=Serendipita indica (strain DSM 11827) TaxID=1109443 RepID=G4TNR6_SERID|nr:hypothetical protein PIIN_06924 [Serendipita indica DSM 11827]